MKRVWPALATVVAALTVYVPEALALHGGAGAPAASGGFPWGTVFLWGGIGVGIVLILTWIVATARRHHWHMPHRPIHA